MHIQFTLMGDNNIKMDHMKVGCENVN